MGNDAQPRGALRQEEPSDYVTTVVGMWRGQLRGAAGRPRDRLTPRSHPAHVHPD